MFRLDPDFGWHLQSGRHIRENGIPKTDIFTYSAGDFEWVNHEWLSDVLLSYIFDAAGYIALSIAYTALWIGAIRIAIKRQINWIDCVLIVGLLPFIGVRQMAIGLILFAICFSAIRSQGMLYSHRLSLILHSVMLIWVNVHGSFVLLFGLIGYFGVLRRRLWLLALAPSLALTTLLNPYGPEIYTEVLRTALDSSLDQNIQEWRSFGLSSVHMAIIAAWGSVALITKGQRSKHPMPNLMLTLALIALAVKSLRNVPIAFLIIGADLDTLGTRLLDYIGVYKQEHLSRLKTMAALISITIISILMPWQHRDIVTRFDRELNYPESSTVDALNSSGCRQNVFAHYNVAGYLIWRAPDYKYFIDGRMPSWEKPDGSKYIDEYKEINGSAEAQMQHFEQFNVSCAVVKHDSELAKRLIDNGWNRPAPDENQWTLLQQN